MASSRNTTNDRVAGEIMLNAVFKVVQQLNAAAGPSMVTKGARSGNMTFSPKIILEEDGHKLYACFVEVYTPISNKTGTEISMAWNSTSVEQFTQALSTVFPALSGLAKEGYISDMYTVGLLKPNSEEIEVYAPQVLEPGMYSLNES